MSKNFSHKKNYLHQKTQGDQVEDTRSHLRAFLTTIKNHQSTERHPRLYNNSLNLSPHIIEKESPQNNDKFSLPMIVAKRKTSVTKKLSEFQQHIISNYLNAQLKIGKSQPLAPKKKSHRRKQKQKILNLKQQIKINTQNTTIQEAQLQTIRTHNGDSGFQSIDGKKQYSLKEEPMKHYVQQKLDRKKRQWKSKTPLELQTYFYSLKKKAQNIQSINPILKNFKNKKALEICIPSSEELSNFIKRYQPKNKEIKTLNLIKQQNFKIDYGQEYLYFGEIIDNFREGVGIFIKDKYLFEGRWTKNMRFKGMQFTQWGVYEGSFKNDKKEGKGQFRWANGEFYSGQWLVGKKHGVGLWTSPNGDSYMGQWKKGIVQGQGIHKTASGQRYEGCFKNYLKNGWGKQSFPNGDKYEGQYAQGLPHGQGKYYWANGVTYEGDFFQGYRQGKGILLSESGFNFTGNFLKQFANGYCEINYGNGYSYNGQIRNGKRNGKGTYRNNAQRKIFDGIWKDDQFGQIQSK